MKLKTLHQKQNWIKSLLTFFTIKITVKELIEQLKEYPEDTKIFVENFNDFRGLTYLEEPGIELKEEVQYNVDNDNGRIFYASYNHHDGEMKNVLIIN